MLDSSGVDYYVDSADLCMYMHADILGHEPVWLVSYNCYQFDKLVMSYHDEDTSYASLSLRVDTVLLLWYITQKGSIMWMYSSAWKIGVEADFHRSIWMLSLRYPSTQRTQWK
jgi:hypothetical protein